MTRRVAATAFAVLFAAGLQAYAGNPEQHKPVEQSKATDGTPGKHLALVNLYLATSILNAKALSTLTEMNLPPNEMNAKEAIKNLDASIKGAMVHVARLKKLNDPAFTQISELDLALKNAKNSLATLKKAKAGDIEMQVDQLNAHLDSAQNEFRAMAKTASFMPLEDRGLHAVPVKGQPEKQDEQKPIAPPKQEPPLPEPAQPTSPPSKY
jgi:hypothetical protein